jgi:hypothetical protein
MAQTINNIRPAAARAFVRSLNILLKFARMYDFGHPRTAKQYETAWSELRAALGSDDEAGLLLAASGDQLLLDGTPLESAAAEKSFARMLSAAGIASIHFSPHITQASLARFVRGFPTGTSSKPTQLVEQLKTALEGDPHIHVNEVCFVPADSAVARSTVAAQLAARTLGMNSEQTNDLLNDPEKLLKLIVAAEGTNAEKGGSAGIGEAGAESAGSGTGGSEPGESPNPFTPARGESARWTNASFGIRGNRSARGGPGTMAVETGLMTLNENELQGILQVLAQIARTSETSKDKLDPASFQSRLSSLPRRARFTLSQALSGLAAQAPDESSDKPTLLKLAENIAVRFALERYERGDVKVDAVRQLLDEMNTEVDGLRKVLGVYEERMKRAGIDVGSHVDVLAQEFWALMPEEKKKAVIESADIWCVPPAKVRAYLDDLVSRGETSAAETTLRNYAACIRNQSPEARRQAAMGVAELAAVYAKSDEKLFVDTIREVGIQLTEEHDSGLQSVVGAAFVRLSQEAQNLRCYPAIQRSVEMLNFVETERPGAGKSLRPRIAVENHLPEFIDESLRAGAVPSGLRDVLRRLPEHAAEQIAARFGRAGFREDCELLVSMMETLGTEGLDHLRAQLRQGEASEAIDTVGILVRMDREIIERVLPERMKDWKRTAHDRVVRQIAASGAVDRGQLLLQLFDTLDVLIRPLAIDEIGMSGENAADMLLLRIAEGDVPKGSTEYLRLKAIEALGRLRTSGSEAILRKVAEARKAWRWAHPSELRLVAAQALEKIDADWARHFIPKSGLNLADLSIETLDSDPTSSAIRQRRYPRLRLDHPVSATTTNLRENHRVEIPEMALSGGVAVCEQSLHPGSVVELRLSAGQKAVKAQTIVRDANTQARAFEVVDMDLDERAKLRKLLVDLGNTQKQTTSQERSRRGTRTLLTGGS